jgi:hypothetical protein
MSNTFISYSRQHEAIVKNLADALKQLGHTVWFDQELSGGQAWWEQILGTIRDCDIFIYALAPEVLNSTACQRECDYAAALSKPILPVIIADGVSTNLLPPKLSKLQFIDYRQQDFNAALRLARAFNNLPAPAPLPNPLPPLPEIPISYLGSLTEKIETASSLTIEEQSSILIDLKRGFHDTETSNDAISLIRKLRKRRDLFAAIADEIDELIGNQTAPPPVQPQYRIDKTTQPEPRRTSKISNQIQQNKPSYFNAILCHIAGGLGLFYVDKNLRRKWLYLISFTLPIFILFACSNPGSICYGNSLAIFALVLLILCLVIYLLSFIDVLVVCHQRRKIKS